MAAYSAVIAGPWRAYSATAGTSLTVGGFPATPSGFTAIGDNLLSDAGIRINWNRTTEAQYVNAEALPVAAFLKQEGITLQMDFANLDPDFLAVIKNRSKSTVSSSGTNNAHESFQLDSPVGRLPELALVLSNALHSPVGGADKGTYLWFPRVAFTELGETALMASPGALVPVTVQVIKDNSSNPTLYAES